MTETERLAAIEEIRLVKARYWRGVDTSDGPLVQSILSRDCVLDYRGCCTDPASGRDFLPVITVHQGHQHEIEITSDTTARGVWAFTDRFFMPPGSPFSRLVGYGHYHDTYEKLDGDWLLKTMRFTRLWVETS